jgi:hypothetical protein
MPAGPKLRQRADTTGPAAPRLPARFLAPLAQRPIESSACAVFAALLTGILLNALALQNARHPSPLFGTSVSLAPLEAPRPVPRPISISAPPTATQSAPPVAIPTRPIAAPRDAEPAKPTDAIGDMLRGAPASSSGAASANPSAIEATRILLVQKALMKLGYMVRPDGVMGATTHQAIEKFERDRGWPPHGELTPKVLREIAARSGLSLE